MAKVSMLTTVDNPYDPFSQFDEWLAYDHQKGYFTNEYLARVAYPIHSLGDIVYQESIEQAIDDILEHDYGNIYKRVSVEVD